MLEFLENQVVDFFSKMPCGTYTSSSLSSYERLLLHAVSQYHCLISRSKFSMVVSFYSVVLLITSKDPPPFFFFLSDSSLYFSNTSCMVI